MGAMTNETPVAQTIAGFVERFGKPQPPATQLHRITWFVGGAVVDFEMECLHEEMPENFRCDKEAAEEERQLFFEYFDGDRAPLRNGIIETRWEGSGEESELYWKYANEPTPLEAVPGPDEKLLLELRALEEYFTASLSEENGRHVSYSASSAYEDAIRRVRQLLARHTEPADTTDADARSLAALSDEVSYCLFFRPSTALGPTSPAAQKVTRLAGWLHTDGWRRTGPARPLESLKP